MHFKNKRKICRTGPYRLPPATGSALLSNSLWRRKLNARFQTCAEKHADAEFG